MALKWLRDNLRHLKFVLWGVVIVFVLLVFVDWGSGRGSGGGHADAALRIGNREVGEQEFVNQVKLLRDFYQRQLGDEWDQFKNQVDLGQQAVQQIIERQLLLEECARVGLVVSAAELQEEILSLPVFTNERGEFIGNDKYRQVLRSNRTNPQEFEAGLQEDLLLAKLRGMILDGMWVGDAEVEQSIRREGDRAEVRVLQLRYERYLAEVEVDDAAARQYFAAHSEDFAREEERVIRYLVVETNKLRRLLEVEETELETYYSAHQEDFREGEQVQASHILIRLAPDASEADQAAAELKADQVAKLARGDADFAMLAEKHSEDPGSKANGGDLGWFGRGRMMKEFEEAVFAGKPGEILGPVKSQFGYHIIEVVGYRPDRVRPFDEVKEDVRFRYLESHAAAEAESRAGLLAKRVTTEQADTDEMWQLIADEDDSVVLNESPPLNSDDTIPGTGSDPGFIESVFVAELGAIGGPKPIPRGWIVWQVKEIRLAGVPPFEDAQDEVEQVLRREGAMKIALERAAILADAWRAGGDVESLAVDNNTTVVDANDHRRGTAFGALGNLSVLDAEVFSSTTGAIVGPISIPGRGVVVAGVDRLSLVSDSEIDDQRTRVRRRLMSERADLLMTSIINERRRGTVVTVNNELLARFSPQG